MSCGYEEDLTAYLDGELPPSRQEEVGRHLSGCGACREVEARLRRSVERLATLPAFEPSAGHSVDTEMSCRQPTRRSTGWRCADGIRPVFPCYSF